MKVFLICFMSLLRSPTPENFYPGVNLEFSDGPLPLPSSMGLGKVPSSLFHIGSGIWRNVWKIWRKMREIYGKYEEICGTYEEKIYVENVKKCVNFFIFPSISALRLPKFFTYLYNSFIFLHISFIFLYIFFIFLHIPGTWKNSELLPRLWNRTILSFPLGPGTWKNSKLPPSSNTAC